MDETKLARYIDERYDDPFVKPFYEFLNRWKKTDGLAWKEFKMLIQRAENGEFK